MLLERQSFGSQTVLEWLVLHATAAHGAKLLQARELQHAASNKEVAV